MFKRNSILFKVNKIIDALSLRSLTVLVSGSVVAQILPLLMQPVLKRLFTPSDFGEFDLYFRIYSVLAIFFTLRYERAIVIIKDKKKSDILFAGIILLCFLFFLIFEIILFFILPFLQKQFDVKNLNFLFFTPLAAFLFASSFSTQYFFIRGNNYRKVSLIKIVRRTVEIITQTIGVFFKINLSLIIGESIGQITIFFFITKNIKLKAFFVKENFQILKDIAKKYIDFPKYSLVSNLLNTVVLSSLTFQVYQKFSIEDVGLLELTQRILTIPFGFIGLSLGQIILKNFSEYFNTKKKMKFVLLKYFVLGLVFIIPFDLIIYLYGNSIFELIFGSLWTNSAKYAVVLLSSTTVFFLFSPLGQILIALEKIKLNSIWEIIKFAAIISLFFLNFKSLDSYLVVYNLVLLFVYSLYGLIILKVVLNYDKKIKD